MNGDCSAIYIGFILGGERLMGRMYTGSGEPLGVTVLEVEIEAEQGPEGFLRNLGKLTTLLLRESGANWTAVRGIGVGLPAPLKDGIVQDRANMEHPAWTNWPAEVRLVQYFEGMPVVIENDANLAAYGEWTTQNGARRHDLIVVVAIGTGIGGGIILGGGIFRGQGAAGEFGRFRMTMDPYAFWYPGRKGTAREDTVEYFASQLAMARQLEERFADARFDPEHRHPLREVGRSNTGGLNFHRMAEEAARFADEGDELCLGLFRLREEAIGQLLFSVGLMFNPHGFILGGHTIATMSAAFREKFINRVKEQMVKRLQPVLPGYEYDVVAAKLGDEAAVFGSAMLARDSAGVQV
ncbi:MAG TPA: ROK family protein [Verrucomicrobiales bacterium]|nr:ROK family protein [Verrucomicrobiales bacterium]